MDEFSLGRALPNSDLPQRSNAVGSSGVNVQDANLLKVYAVYGAPMIVPIIGPLFALALALNDDLGEFEKALLRKNRLPVIASATVHMQSRAIRNDFMVSRAELDSQSLCRGNLLRSFLDINTLGDNAQQCLRDTGQSAVVTGGNCASCRSGIVPPDGVNRCFACALDLGGVAECFNGNVAG